MSSRLMTIAVLGCIALVSSARAHDPGLSSIHVVGRAGWAELIVQFAPADLLLIAPIDQNKDGKLSRAEFEAGRPELERIALSWVEVSRDNQSIPLRSLGVQFQEHENNVVLSLNASAPPLGVWTLTFPHLADLPSRHRQFLTAAGQSRRIVAETLLAATHPKAIVDWQTKDGKIVEAQSETDSSNAAEKLSQPSGAKLFGNFVVLGIEHILIGFDHLLFLAGLLLACRHFKSMLGIITSFTVAHSITLALATFKVVALPSQWIEAAIAASILYVGIENIVRREEPRSRWLLTFFLGLIHGFGFASVLGELGIGANGTSFVTPLVGFNLGVELGQVAVAAIFLPILFYARRFTWFEKRGVKISSGLVAAAGLFWLVQRLFF